MIRKIQPDPQKAASLRNMAKITWERLEETDKMKYPSNTLKDYYDSIHELLEALTLQEGIKVKGEGAHQELIDYVVKKYSFPENERIFLQQIREYRNKISYEGFMIDPEFMERNDAKIKVILKKLFRMIK